MTRAICWCWSGPRRANSGCDAWRLTAARAALCANWAAAQATASSTTRPPWLSDAAGNVLILDAAGGTIRRFSRDGRWLETLSPADGEGNPPAGARDLALDTEGSVLVADTNRDRLLRIAPDGGVQAIAADADLYEPQSVCAGPGGMLLVADTNHSRIVQLGGGPPRELVGADQALEFPSRVRLAASGQVVAVLDRGGNRALRFNLAGQRTGQIQLPASGEAAGSPDLALDAAGHAVLINPVRQSVVILDFVE